MREVVSFEEFDPEVGFIDSSAHPLEWDVANKIIRRTIYPLKKILIILGINTGLRAGDLRHLKWKYLFNDSIFQSRKSITLIEKKTRNRPGTKRRTIVFNTFVQIYIKKFVILLEPNMNDYIFSYNKKNAKKVIDKYSIWRMFNSLINELDVETKGTRGTHVLRKTFALRMYELYEEKKPGTGVIMAGQMLGHRDIATTMTYLGFTRKMQEDAFNYLYHDAENDNVKKLYTSLQKQTRRGRLKHISWPIQDEEE